MENEIQSPEELADGIAEAVIKNYPIEQWPAIVSHLQDKLRKGIDEKAKTLELLRSRI